MKDELFDYRKGEAAKLLRSLIEGDMLSKSDFMYQEVVVSPTEVMKINGHKMIRDGEHLYLAFNYLRRAWVDRHGLPKYHTRRCFSRLTYSGYVFTNGLPAPVYDRGKEKELGPQVLEMCVNCKAMSFYSIDDLEGEVIDYVSKHPRELRRDGYHKMWRQFSKAIRSRRQWQCEACHLDLRNDIVNLEVHHEDRNPANNDPTNLKSLCVKCHSEVDAHHRSNYSKGLNKIKLDRFKRDYNTK